MTDEELDRARAEEAWSLWRAGGRKEESVAHVAVRLTREGWKPVDPDLAEARKICGSFYSEQVAGEYARGIYDPSPYVKGVKLAIKRGRELEREGK